jgi:hypothetical protein
VLAAGERPGAVQLQALLPQAGRIAGDNRAWIAEHALFADSVSRFVQRVQAISGRA